MRILFACSVAACCLAAVNVSAQLTDASLDSRTSPMVVANDDDDDDEPGDPQQVEVINFPNPQTVVGTVEVSNLPSVQPVSGTVAIVNLPVDVDGRLLVARPSIANHFLSLLDSDLFLEGPTTNRWVSGSFDTSDFNRLGLLVDSINNSHPTYLPQCQLYWEWPDGARVFPADASPVVAGSSPKFYDIRGTSAHLECWILASGVSATLTDIRVFLRRE